MALQFATVANSIAAVSVSGVTIKDIDEIIEFVSARDCPLVQPVPNGFVSGLNVERDSQGLGSVAMKTVMYTLTYRLMYAPIGTGRGLFDVYDDMVAKAGLFLDALISNDALTGTIDITPTGALNFGPVLDPAGNSFHGCDFQLKVMEFVN